jgi:23S rRNA (cytosine1962-C5)-methyltransferase
LRLKKPLERVIHAGHPWIFRDALASCEGAPGTVAEVVGKTGRFLARGLVEAGPIGVRVFTTRDEPVDESLFRRRMAEAIALRARVVPGATEAWRVLHGEGDRLPGIVCDRYGPHAVLRLDGEAAHAWRPRIEACLHALLPEIGVQSLLMRGERKRREAVALAWGDAPPDEVVVQEHGMLLSANLWRGQKTGLFLDHRESRRRARELASGARVLDLYAYTGGFSVAAGLGGAAHVTTVDASVPAVEHAKSSWALNGLDPTRHATCVGDAAEILADHARGGHRYDLVIADPPSFAPNEAAKPAALESYAELHRGALGVLAPGGLYLAASCSSHVTREDFDATLREGARRARRVLQVLDRWGAPPDHPRLLAFPEGDYLKVSLLRAVE